MRRAYVECILKQDIGWFDEHPAGQLPTAVTANMAKVQDGLGRKVGDIVLNGLSGKRGRGCHLLWMYLLSSGSLGIYLASRGFHVNKASPTSPDSNGVGYISCTRGVGALFCGSISD